jgi:hypothetical protein
MSTAYRVRGGDPMAGGRRVFRHIHQLIDRSLKRPRIRIGCIYKREARDLCGDQGIAVDVGLLGDATGLGDLRLECFPLGPTDAARILSLIRATARHECGDQGANRSQKEDRFSYLLAWHKHTFLRRIIPHPADWAQILSSHCTSGAIQVK